MSQSRTIIFGRRSTAQLLFALGMSLIVVFSLVPAVGILVVSFTDIRSLPFLPVHFVGLENYATFFSSAQLGYNLNALKNTLFFAVAVTLLQNVIALFIAVLLNMRLRGRNFARAVVFMPTILGVTIIGLVFSLIFNPSGGPAASVWGWFGSSSAFFGDPSLAMPLVIGVSVWAGSGWRSSSTWRGCRPSRPELYEVASIDGASSWQRLRFVTIPLLAPSITANTLLSLIGALQSYQLIYVLTGPINPATQVLSLAIFTQGFGGAQGGHGPVAGLRGRDLDGPVRHRDDRLAGDFGVPATQGDGAVSAVNTPTTVAGAAVGVQEDAPLRGGPAPQRGKVVLYALMALVVLMYLYPLLFLVNTALKSEADFISNPTGLVTSPEFSNFATAVDKGNFAAYLLNSVLYTLVAATLGTVVSLLVGFPVARGYVKHTRLWNATFAAMLFLPNTLITVFQLALRLNLYDTRLGYILIMASGVGVGPLLITGYLKSVPREIDEAAALDGVGYVRYVFGFLPTLIKPVLATIFILQAIGVWNDIILATILLPDASKSPVTLGLFAFKGTYVSQWSLLSAATIIVAAPLIATYVFLQRYLVASVVGGAVKG